jgi:transketolase
MERATADLRSDASFDHVGRDRDNVAFVAWKVLAEVADHDPRIVGATADLTWVTRLADFGDRHRDRIFQFGIAERNMISAAAGMATCGLIPYVSTFASFSGILAFENIRTDLAYPRLPVRVLATHGGISMGYFGTSHHATEDIAALRSVADLMILSPADPASTERLIRNTVDHPGPIYFRLGRGAEPVLYESLPDDYGPGDPWVVTTGSDVLLVSTGIMVGQCADAAELLGSRGIAATVLDVHTLKPFSADAVARHAETHPVVVTVEEHNIEGGLGSMVCEAVSAARLDIPVYKHGLRDEFAIVGPPTHLYRYYGLDPSGIASVTTRVLDQVSAVTGPLHEAWSTVDRQQVVAAARAAPEGTHS